MEAPEQLFKEVACSHEQPYPTQEDDTHIKRPVEFTIEDLLDFSNDALSDDGLFDLTGGASSLSATLDSTNSSSVIISYQPADATCCGIFDTPFPGADLDVPHEEVAELEWLSNFVEESFSSDDLQRVERLSKEVETQTSDVNGEKGVKGKARSKRGRAAACNWTARGLVSAATSCAEGTPSVGETEKQRQVVAGKRERGDEEGGGGGRRCVHCDTDKTPQWRTGPMGPKTLCNACGVRYKSGRLVPEYRPASSPTFVLTKHSNSHRKVMELRRQKETHLHHRNCLQLQLLEESVIMDGCHQEDDDDHHYLITDMWVNEGSCII